jgi:hypothetical protein
MCEGPSLSWSYGGWIYNYLFNQCLSPLKLWVWILLRRSVLDTTLCDEVCQWLATGWLFSPVFSTNKTDRHNITEILMKVALNIITLTPVLYICVCVCVCVWLLFTAKWANFQLYHGENNLHFQWNDDEVHFALDQQPRIDKSLYSDTLSWFRANQSLLFLFNAMCLAKRQ